MFIDEFHLHHEQSVSKQHWSFGTTLVRRQEWETSKPQFIRQEKIILMLNNNYKLKSHVKRIHTFISKHVRQINRWVNDLFVCVCVVNRQLLNRIEWEYKKNRLKLLQRKLIVVVVVEDRNKKIISTCCKVRFKSYNRTLKRNSLNCPEGNSWEMFLLINKWRKWKPQTHYNLI